MALSPVVSSLHGLYNPILRSHGTWFSVTLTWFYSFNSLGGIQAGCWTTISTRFHVHYSTLPLCDAWMLLALLIHDKRESFDNAWSFAWQLTVAWKQRSFNHYHLLGWFLAMRVADFVVPKHHIWISKISLAQGPNWGLSLKFGAFEDIESHQVCWDFGNSNPLTEQLLPVAH